MAALDENPTPSPFDPQALAAHHRFVRQLARGLVGDGDAADELTARAFAAAVAARPETGASFRIWLERVTRRLFHRERRDQERRERRERVAATTEATGSTVDLVAEMELHRQVARAFESLEEPAKSALFLRYFHDRTPTQIAEQLNLPLGTVKSRLQRGLHHLRERLDAAHRGRRDEWLAGMLPWIGGPFVTTKVKLAPLAIAALLLAGATVGVNEMWKRSNHGAAPASLPAPAHAESAAAPKSAAPDAAPGAPSAQRTPVAADPAALPFASGIVVDEKGAPVAGCDVVAGRLRRDVYNDFNEQEPARFDRLERDLLATSAADGRFVVTEPREELAVLLFVRAGFAAGEAADLAADRAKNQELRVVLHAGATLRGTVVDTDQRPIARAIVSVVPSSDPSPQAAERVAAHLPGAPRYLARQGFQQGASDEKGAFAFASIPAGKFRLSVMEGGYTWTQIAPEAITDPCEVVMTRNALLIDVGDGDTHEPIDAALIATDAKSGAVLEQVVPWQPADPDHSVFAPKGRLILNTGYHEPYDRGTPAWLSQATEQRAALKIHVVAGGYVGELVEVTLSTKEEPPHLKVELTPAAGSNRDPSITGRVGGATTKATLLAYALVPGWSDSYLESRPALLTVATEGDGSFELFDLPKGRYRLRADAAGCSPAWAEVEAPAADVVLNLAASATLEVLVRNHAGKPAADVAIHAQQSDDKHAWKGRTGADGIATLERLPAVALRVGAFEKLFYDTVDAKVVYPLNATTLPDDPPITLKPGEKRRIEIVLVERMPMHLHFERDDGTPVARAKLEVMNFAGPVAAQSQELQRLRPLPLEIDSRGDATASLYPGHYTFEASETNVKRIVEFDVPRSGEGRATVRLPALGPTGTLAGRLVDLVTHQPIAKRKVFAWQKVEDARQALDLGMQLSDDDGRFRFADVPAGTVSLRVEAGVLPDLMRWVRPDPDSPYGRSDQECAVEAGRVNDVEIALPPVRTANATFKTVDLDAHVTDAATGRPLEKAFVEVTLKLGATSHELLDERTDHDGRLSAKLFAGESYSVVVWSRGESGDDSNSPYVTQHLDLAPQDGVLRVEVALAKRR